MIHNIVFDMGDVLMRFDLPGAAAAVTDSPEDALCIQQGVFQSPWWSRMDRGGSREEAQTGMLRALPQRLHGAAVDFLDRWDEWLTPNGEMNALAQSLADAGYSLYLLSNVSERFYSFRDRIPAVKRMSGFVLSFEERLLKPDLDLYRRLLERYALPPEDCFFIDDVFANVEAAWAVGMHSHCFRGDMSCLRQALADCGVSLAP